MSRYRLQHPSRFGTEGRALGYIRDNSLFPIGAQVIELRGAAGSPWRVIIDTGRPDVVARYLAQHLPGVEWVRSELAG
jgi:hypothetical protein